MKLSFPVKKIRHFLHPTEPQKIIIEITIDGRKVAQAVLDQMIEAESKTRVTLR